MGCGEAGEAGEADKRLLIVSFCARVAVGGGSRKAESAACHYGLRVVVRTLPIEYVAGCRL